MGNYSRDPVMRAADATLKQYYATRMQQGVPVLDADVNILDDIRRLEHEAVGKFVLGNGVPHGSDAFHIFAIENGGIGTITLQSNAAAGKSAVMVDLAASTGAGALGFSTRNARAERTSTTPALLSGFRAEPFLLVAGMTLVVSAENHPAETVTFAAGDFANIAAATADEVVAVMTAQLTRVTPAKGAGNDFIIRGPNPTNGAPGRIFVDGQLVVNPSDITYQAQALFENATLATAWGVTPVAALPATAVRIAIFLDVFGREVDSKEDPDMVDSRIGMETAIRLRREWAVRTASEVDFAAAIPPAGHTFYPLALLSRSAADPAVRTDMLTDVRETDLALRREVAFYGSDGTLLVESEMFRAVLTLTRDNVREFIAFLTQTFIPPTATYFAGEVGGISVLNAVAGLAEQGLTVLDARSLDTRGAFALLEQLRNAEQRVTEVWRTSMFPIERPVSVKVYENAFLTNIQAIEKFLTGPAPVGYTALETALGAGDLLNAVRAQEQIASEFGASGSKPSGSLLLTYLGSPSNMIVRNVPFDLEFELSGTVTPEDDIVALVFIDGAWQTTLRNSNGSTPLALHFGPGNDTKKFLVTVRPPDVAVAQTPISLRVHAKGNPGGLAHMSGQMMLKIGDPPPGSAEEFAISVLTANATEVAGVYQVPVTFMSADFLFAIHNHTNTAVNVDLEFLPAAAAGWTIVPPMGWPGSANTNVPIAAQSSVNRLFQFVPPGIANETLAFTLRAREAGTVDVIADIHIALLTIP